MEQMGDRCDTAAMSKETHQAMPLRRDAAAAAWTMFEVLAAIKEVWLETNGEDIDDDQDFFEFGMDSLGTVIHRNELLDKLAGIDLSPTAFFDYPTPKALALAIAEQSARLCQVFTERVVARTHVSTDVSSSEIVAKSTQITSIDRAIETKSHGSTSSVYTLVPGEHRHPKYLRVTDGMECIFVSANTAWIGDGLGGRAALPNEIPCHTVKVRSFLIDVEPVTVSAFASFLNAVQPSPGELSDWCQLKSSDIRAKHLPLHCDPDGLWRPKSGIPDKWPMIMVSWYGANAYSLWANACDWKEYHSAKRSFLPTEVQWEYAARGPTPTRFPWGDSPASPNLLNVCWDAEKLDPDMPLEAFPIMPVDAELGVSFFGLRHMAGNVWQWCRDTYDPSFYTRPDASVPDAWNSAQDGPKVERGGSWVGPASVARASYRRGRAAGAKGRCLGFRCIGDAGEVLRSASCPDGDSTACSDSGSADYSESRMP